MSDVNQAVRFTSDVAVSKDQLVKDINCITNFHNQVPYYMYIIAMKLALTSLNFNRLIFFISIKGLCIMQNTRGMAAWEKYEKWRFRGGRRKGINGVKGLN